MTKLLSMRKKIQEIWMKTIDHTHRFHNVQQFFYSSTLHDKGILLVAISFERNSKIITEYEYDRFSISIVSCLYLFSKEKKWKKRNCKNESIRIDFKSIIFSFQSKMGFIYRESTKTEE